MSAGESSAGTYSQRVGAQDLVFRELTHQDLPAMEAIEASGYQFPWTQRLLEGCLGVGHDAWGGWFESELVGFVLSSTVLDEIHLLNICVDARCHNRGIGRRLLRHLIARAQRQQAAWILLEVRASNAGALALYESEGFAVIGERPGYYQGIDQREDALVMKLALGEELRSSR